MSSAPQLHKVAGLLFLSASLVQKEAFVRQVSCYFYFYQVCNNKTGLGGWQMLLKKLELPFIVDLLEHLVGFINQIGNLGTIFDWLSMSLINCSRINVCTWFVGKSWKTSCPRGSARTVDSFG
jgi:hypothetical protein